ncbi:hypothetical protein N0B16_11430 [Chryseobacterium sp. GMJ5]|uniref:Uncharacterized protein n=1 Tax=Chryseobacterium gilvum TaxID=2976534 RepID=A0ABT2W2W5_9FLAO|nr:hypothetical protein [Chryseobacterium gilvum]MCU7615050.1 hypothetical protein [Chryseobacterium gilvum]
MFFTNFFKKKKTLYSKTNGLSKAEYFEKYHLIKLFDLLREAMELIEEIAIINSDAKFIHFKDVLFEEIYEVKGDNIADFTRIWNWFKPENEWSKYTKSKGIEIGYKIFNITNAWKVDDDFISGTKVFLNNKCGIVIKNENDNNCGIIRWDTPKAIDEENWIGMFGIFKEAGGIIIENSHQFKYINDDGSLKMG